MVSLAPSLYTPWYSCMNRSLKDLLGCLTPSPTHPSPPLLPNSFYQLFDNSQLPGVTEAQSSILAKTLTQHIAFLVSRNLPWRFLDFKNEKLVRNCSGNFDSSLRQWGWGLILMGECSGLIWTVRNGKLPAKLRRAIAQWQSPHAFPYEWHNFEL